MGEEHGVWSSTETGFESWLFHVLAVWLWVSHLTLLCFRCFTGEKAKFPHLSITQKCGVKTKGENVFKALKSKHSMHQRYYYYWLQGKNISDFFLQAVHFQPPTRSRLTMFSRA